VIAMSRHTLTPLDGKENLTVVVGWDPPLRTYFAQVMDFTAENEDADDEQIDHLWIGTDWDEIQQPGQVLDAVRPYATVPADLAAALFEDRILRR
jgi:hypothetical protein